METSAPCKLHTDLQFYRGAQAAIVVYDITNADTFARAKTWVRELQRQVSMILPFILLSEILIASNDINIW